MNIIKLQGNIEKRKGIHYEYDVDSTPLGEGGMGRVFKGYRIVERTGEKTPVAIKAIYDNIPERVVERARREANIQLDNDNLIRMYGFVETVSHYEGGSKCKVHYHVIMELLVGVTLDDIIKGVVSDNNGMQIPFAAEIYNQYMQDRNKAVVRIMKPILSGLMALHDKGYIHRDIDPSNIMVTIDGKIKLIDFGICKQVVSLESLDKALTASGVFMGKVNYAAPEMVLGDVRSQNYTTDIYALGILMYQLCTGHLPFSGTDQDVLAANLHKAVPIKDVHNRTLKHIIRKSTEKIQSKRYSSVSELRVDLDRVQLASGHSKPHVLLVVTCLIGVLVLGGVLLSIPFRRVDHVIVAPQRSVNEIYNEALTFIERKDSLELYARGKEQLRILAEDSLYMPARVKYYVLMINSRSPEEVRKGYNGLERIVAEDSMSNIALFECGLTLSKSNRHISVPLVRQSLLDLNEDLERANELLYKSMELDSTDYKSVYWAFNNLMEMELNGTLPKNGYKEMVRLHTIFNNRILYHNDAVTEVYKNAMVPDTKTLKAWGLIR